MLYKRIYNIKQKIYIPLQTLKMQFVNLDQEKKKPLLNCIKQGADKCPSSLNFNHMRRKQRLTNLNKPYVSNFFMH